MDAINHYCLHQGQQDDLHEVHGEDDVEVHSEATWEWISFGIPLSQNLFYDNSSYQVDQELQQVQ